MPKILCVLLFTYFAIYFHFVITIFYLFMFKSHSKLTFMRKFGYLVPNSELTETLYDDDTFVSAIKNMQKYGGLNETGVLDRRTLKVSDQSK